MIIEWTLQNGADTELALFVGVQFELASFESVLISDSRGGLGLSRAGGRGDDRLINRGRRHQNALKSVDDGGSRMAPSSPPKSQGLTWYLRASASAMVSFILLASTS